MLRDKFSPSLSLDLRRESVATGILSRAPRVPLMKCFVLQLDRACSIFPPSGVKSIRGARSHKQRRA